MTREEEIEIKLKNVEVVLEIIDVKSIVLEINFLKRALLNYDEDLAYLNKKTTKLYGKLFCFLGNCYEMGWGVNANLQLARYYWRIAVTLYDNLDARLKLMQIVQFNKEVENKVAKINNR